MIRVLSGISLAIAAAVWLAILIPVTSTGTGIMSLLMLAIFIGGFNTGAGMKK
jgi:hypothetical protein